MKRIFPVLLLTALLSAGCSTYEYKPVPFMAAESYANHVGVFGAVVAARAWTSAEEARQAFGFDIRGAGLTPVQVIVDNRGGHTLEIVPGQTLLQDSQNQLWNLLPARVAYDRVDNVFATSRVGSQAARQGFWGATAGAIIGAAIGVVSGGDAGEAAMRGAAAGGAAGVLLGGASGMSDDGSKRAISADLQGKSLKDKPLAPYALSHGFLFFPGEVREARALRLNLKNLNTGDVRILMLPLQ